jgi:hypothetical protein
MLKECNFDCGYVHEGICCLEIETGLSPELCTVKSNEDLVSEDD